MNTVRIMALIVAGLLLAGKVSAQEKEETMVKLMTTAGDITLELYADKAPETVKNFLRYVDDGFYKGTVFHRVIPSFMIQGGGFDGSMGRKQTHAPIRNEAANALKNERGTIAMARTSIPDSASSQFFINTVDNASLNFRNPTAEGIGYCVFGRVVEGMAVVDAIESTQTGIRNGMRDVPVKDIVITDAIRLTPVAPTATESAK